MSLRTTTSAETKTAVCQYRSNDAVGLSLVSSNSVANFLKKEINFHFPTAVTGSEALMILLCCVWVGLDSLFYNDTSSSSSSYLS